MSRRNAAPVSLFAAIFALALSACGGGAQPSVGPPSPSPRPSSASATPPPIPSAAPFSLATASQLPAVSISAGQTPRPIPVTLPTSAAGFGGAMLFPATSIAAKTEAIVTLSNQPPPGVPTALARKHAQTLAAMEGATFVPLLFLQVMFSGGVSVANQPSVTFDVPSNEIVNGASYWVALYDPTRPSLGWELGFEGPGAASGSSVAFNGGSGTFSFVPFEPYVFALYAQSASAATPAPPPTPSPTPVPTATPAPGATPTPIPSPGFGVSPSSISLLAIGATQSITATGSAPYFAFTSNANVASVTPANGDSPFTVTATGAGTAQVTIVDGNGKQAIIPVTVTTVTIPVL